MPYPESEPPMGEVGILGSALPEQHDAVRTFLEVATANPALAIQALDIHGSGKRIRNPQLRSAAQAVNGLFDTSADQYMVLGSRVDAATADLHQTWQGINHSSRSTSEEAAAARWGWRQARVRSYLAGLLAGPAEEEKSTV